MRVQRVVMAVTGAESWTVVDGGWAPVEPVERCLAHLAGIERSPNTVRAYAHGLRLWFEFLGARGLVWDSVGIEDVSRFVAWLRAPAGNVIVFDDTAAVRSAATVNRHLAALFGFCDLRARSGGVGVAAELVAWRRGSRGSCKPFLRGIAGDGPAAAAAGGAACAAAAAGCARRRGGCCDLGGVHPAAGPVLVRLVGRDGHAGRPGARSGARGLREPPAAGAHRGPGRQRERCPGQVFVAGDGAGVSAAGAALGRLHAHRVRRIGL